jgi:hypothetical protein
VAAFAPAEPLSITFFSAFVRPPGNALMAALKGYFDESGKENDPQFADSAISVAGYVTTVDSWLEIETKWDAVLKRTEFAVPYLHMKEFAHSKPGSPFEEWKDDEPRRAAFLSALAQVIRQSDLVGVGAIVRVPDLAKFNRDNGLDLQAYPFCVYASLIELSRRFPNVAVETLWDKIDRHNAMIQLARDYADSDAENPECGAKVEINPLQKVCSSKNVPALQIADFAAYELLKAHRDRNGWFIEEEPNTDPIMWGTSQHDWLAKKGREWPGNRKSYRSLFGGKLVGPEAPRPMEGRTWTYKSITHCHRLRGGVWSIAAKEQSS